MIPKDKNMLLSYINTKLRDEYKNLDKLCDDLDLDKAELMENLAQIGYNYEIEFNKFC